MRNATTVRIFAVLIGFALALPAAAEAQNSSTLKTEPVSAIAADKVTSSCSSASTLVESTSPGFGGINVGFSTPLDADPLAIFQSVASSPWGSCSGLCVQGQDFCLGLYTGASCSYSTGCVGRSIPGSSGCECKCEGGRRGYPEHCPHRGQRGCD